MPLTDVYDNAERALDRLAERFGWPQAVNMAWGVPNTHVDTEDVELLALKLLAHKLFLYLTPSGEYEINCGCLTQVRGSYFEFGSSAVTASDPLLTEAVRGDLSLPSCELDIERSHVARFKAWQRACDRTIRANPPRPFTMEDFPRA